MLAKVLETTATAVLLRLDLVLMLLLVAALFTWRVFKFTIIPAYYPEDPKELPYWLPIFAHANAFFRNSSALMTRARLHFNNTREPFAITAANSTLYVLTKPEDVAVAYRNTTTLSFDVFVKEVMRQNGVSERGISKLFQQPDPSKHLYPNPFQKSLARLSRELHIHQLFPGNLLPVVSGEFVKYFDKSLNIDSLALRTRYVKTPQDNAVILSLEKFTSDLFTNAGQEAYFGNLLRNIDPEFTWTFLEFDSLTWQVLYQYPKILCGKMLAARDRMIQGMQQYFETPFSERKDVMWFTANFEQELRLLGSSSSDIAAIMMTIYCVNTNTRKAAFWMLSYILFEPSLVDIIRNETEAAFEDGAVNTDFLSSSCPRLKGIWDEVIRLTAFSASVRFLTEDTKVGGKILRKGNRVVIPYRQLHFDSSVFGKDVAEFQSQRFIDQPSLTRHNSWRPFGGGSTQCPGRFMAHQATVVFVAMVLRRFDVLVHPKAQSFPLAEEGNPVLGLMDHMAGSDLQIKLIQRSGNDKKSRSDC